MRNYFCNFLFYTAIISVTVLSGCNKVEGPQIYGTFTDPADGKKYRTIVIGNLEWMADNLNRGAMINSNQHQTDNGAIEKYCYDNDPHNCNRLGGLYTWDEAMAYTSEPGSQGICPAGWWIPTDANWKELEMHLGMNNLEANQTLWRSLDVGEKLKVNGVSNFAALLGGHWFPADRIFYSLNVLGTWWTSTSTSTPTQAWRRSLGAGENGIYRALGSKQNAYSVRCVRHAN